MIDLQYLPLDVVNIILTDTLSKSSYDSIDYQNSLVSLSYTSKFINQLTNSRLYSNITFYDDDNQTIITRNSNRTYIHINKFNEFVNSLTFENFLLIKSIHINCKSNFNKFEYNTLYTKLNQFWNKTHHSIEFINFDIDNIRKNQTILQHLNKHNYYQIIEENDELDNYSSNFTISKLYNLKNWSILNVSEFMNLPINNNYDLKTLDFFIELIIGDESLPQNVINLPELESLNLNTSLSTLTFLQLNLNLPKLSNFVLSYSHTFNRQPINYQNFREKINFENLTNLEIKLNCCHSDCSCINQFYQELSQDSHKLTKLENLSIINHMSKNQSSNLEQYSYLINNQLLQLFTKFSQIESIYININEFIKNDRCKIDWKNFTKAINILPNLKNLKIVDFFNWWIPTLQLTRNSILNNCSCNQCLQTKFKFQALANFDESNNYTHNFSKFNHNENESSTTNLDFNKKSISKFYSFIINHFKTQFNQSIIYSNSLNKFRNQNEMLFSAEFKQLLNHNLLADYVNLLKYKNDKLVVNLGGLLI
ncbi:uncharacterized protein KGF55_004873 [Candida pseudojiufengensis]|uniref:uncharacterized protein n=1 Tax=Candida pseudojiufengensis TaxID=497109 RepID=UPI0022240542|nr:uncharacterized protein KGF55_004873 [Candida pseudojiufengensis]KAI5960150.1 hypothetical protein KGF55_004873 [Candida pseudojiufengensis]